MAAEQAQVHGSEHPPEPDYGARFKQNVRWLISINEGFSIDSTAGRADMGPRTLHGLLAKRANPNPERKTAERIARALGVLMEDLWIDHEQLVEKVNREGLRPFEPRRISDKASSSSSTSEDAADVDLSDFDYELTAATLSEQGKRSPKRTRRKD
jgi:hypothetical protein